MRQEARAASLLPVNLNCRARTAAHAAHTPGHKNPPTPRPEFKREGICARPTRRHPAPIFSEWPRKRRCGRKFAWARRPGPHPAHLPRSIRESDQVDAGTSSRGLAGSPSPIMEPRNACRFTKFNVQGRNRGIPPIDEPSEHRFAPGGQLCAEQRQLRGSTGVPLRLANFRRTATIPSKKRNLKRSSAGGCP